MATKTLNPKTLSSSDRAFLEATLDKDVNDLTAYDISFLQARSQYLTADQREYFSSALKGELNGADVAPSQGSTAELPEGTLNYERHNHADLLAWALGLGLNVNDTMTKKELAKAINDR